MSWWIRQVAVLAADLDGTVGQIAERFDLDVCHRSDRVEGHAMSNALMPVGEQFLEVASPLDNSSPAARLLARRGDCGYLVILQTDDMDAARGCAEAKGAAVTIELPMAGEEDA